MVGWLILQKLERLWKEEIATYSRYCPSTFPGELRKTMKTLRTAGVLAEVRT
jgi:hypothetical protein